MNLYNKHRPPSLAGVVGQDKAVSQFEAFFKRGNVPHAILLHGPSGCGKTTLARIIRRQLACSTEDYFEVNCADFKGIDTIREIRARMRSAPFFGKVKMWVIDEAQKLTGDAQSAILKILEDTPPHVYFVLCTTDPQKISKPIHTRCTAVKLDGVPAGPMESLLLTVAQKEKMDLTEKVVDTIIDCAEGSPRKALVLLEQVGHLQDEDSMLEGLEKAAQVKDQAILLARALINPSCQWQEVASILKDLQDEPESIRYMILGYARSVLLSGGKLAPRAYLIIDCFSRNFYDSKQAGLAAACWEVVYAK